MASKKKRKWKKIRSGRLILGQIQHVGSGTYLWESKRGGKDRGISGNRENAVNNVLRDAGVSRRQYEVSVEDD